MKTFQTPLFDEHRHLKQLFQQLFYFQIELERIINNSDISRHEIEEINRTIDDLLTILIDHYDFVD